LKNNSFTICRHISYLFSDNDEDKKIRFFNNTLNSNRNNNLQFINSNESNSLILIRQNLQSTAFSEFQYNIIRVLFLFQRVLEFPLKIKIDYD